jgi:hypothetical protein
MLLEARMLQEFPDYPLMCRILLEAKVSQKPLEYHLTCRTLQEPPGYPLI